MSVFLNILVSVNLPLFVRWFPLSCPKTCLHVHIVFLFIAAQPIAVCFNTDWRKSEENLTTAVIAVITVPVTSRHFSLCSLPC